MILSKKFFPLKTKRKEKGKGMITVARGSSSGKKIQTLANYTLLSLPLYPNWPLWLDFQQ